MFSTIMNINRAFIILTVPSSILYMYDATVNCIELIMNISRALIVLTVPSCILYV